MYAVQKVIFTRSMNEEAKEYECYFIRKDEEPQHEINKWLEHSGIRSLRTARKYAYDFCKFLNYLDERGKHYKDVNRKDIENYVDWLLFSTDNKNVISFQSNVSYKTVESYLKVIKKFYSHIDYMNGHDRGIMSKKVKSPNKHSYLYGQVKDMEIDELLVSKLFRIKETKQHIKWHSKDEVESIFSYLNTLRDKAIFLLTLEGMRSSEVLNLDMSDYLNDEEIVKIKEGKGNKARIVPLRKRTMEAIENYLRNERSHVEGDDFMEALFVNLRKGKDYGERVQYRNYLKILKRAAARAGLNPDEIKTHSGRSTRTMELLYHQSEHPEDNMTDEHIRQLMGWSSSTSIEPYVKKQDERLLVAMARKINEREEDE